MLTVDDVNRAEFEKAVRGYRAQDVDEFLNKVADTIAQLNNALSEEQKQKEELENELAAQKEIADKKLYTLAEKIEQYRADEENLSAALLNAQRLSESMNNKAKENAQNIINEAKAKAAEMLQDLKVDYVNEEKRLANLRAEVSKFKAEVLYLYKHHIEQLNALPAAHQEEKMHITADENSNEPADKKRKRSNAKAKENLDGEQDNSSEVIEDISDDNEQILKENAESFEEYLSTEFDD